MKRVLYTILFTLCIWLPTRAEQQQEQPQPQEQEWDYKPKMLGAIISSYLVSGHNGLSQFNVSDARFALLGNASRDISYLVHLNLNNYGGLAILETCVKYSRPRYDITFGQQPLYLSEEMMRGPYINAFYTRAFSSNMLLAYPTSDSSLAYLNGCDIGAYGRYHIFRESSLPISICFGVYNGIGANKAAYDYKSSYTARLSFGDDLQGVSGCASIYQCELSTEQQMLFSTFEMRYITNSYSIEGIYHNRRIENDIVQSINIHGYYNIKLLDNEYFDKLQPILRWEMGDNLDYLITDEDGTGSALSKVSAQRITCGLNLHFKGARIRSRLTLGYEKFILGERPSDMAWNTQLHDKFAVSVNMIF